MNYLEAIGLLHIFIYTIYGAFNIWKAFFKSLKIQDEKTDLRIIRTH